MKETKILITGAAGFIGYHVCKRLLEQGYEIIGVDNLNNYYDVRLKCKRVRMLITYNNFSFYKIDLVNKKLIFDLFKDDNIEYVINLAAQAGVRYSLQNPDAYIDSNIRGFVNVLEACRYHRVRHLVYASSSSVYGGNTKIPFSEEDRVDNPLSLYAATKKSDELLAYAYASLYNIPVSGLRFFTVYGEWGRPDMAIYIFTKNIIEGKPIDLYNNGKMKRDFTYIDDIVEGITRVMRKPLYSLKDGNVSKIVPAQIFNIGNNNPVELERLIDVIEDKLNIKAKRKYLPIQPGDVPSTCANIDNLAKYVGFTPSTSIETGISRFIDWYIEYNRIDSQKREKSHIYAKRYSNSL